MTMVPGYHAIFVSLTTGMLVLSFVALSFRFWFRPQHPVARSAWEAADGIAFYAAIFGTLALLVATLTGFGLRPVEAFLTSPITKNKILTVALTIACWTAFLAIRGKGGPQVWNRGFTAHFGYVAALAGSVFLMTTNSIGGDLGGIPSGYEKIAQALGFHTRYAFYVPTAMNVIFWIIGIAAVVLGVRTRGARPEEPTQADAGTGAI
jgi:hypothetical protein